MGKTNISWATDTWNPIRARRRDGQPNKGAGGWACVRVSPGCAHCYASDLNERRGTGLPYTVGAAEDVELYLDERALKVPLHWRKPRRVFVCSMTDLFWERVEEDWLDRIFAVMALTPQHTYQVLTKRAERMRADLTPGRATPVGMAALSLTLEAQARDHRSRIGEDVMLTGDIAHLKVWPLLNVWLGVSCEDQQRADERIPILLDTPAAVRFVSAEPLLGPVDLSTHLGLAAEHDDLRGFLRWVICGGESGPGFRPMDHAWLRSIVEQCRAAGVPVFVKQDSARRPGVTATLSPDLRRQEWPR